MKKLIRPQPSPQAQQLLDWLIREWKAKNSSAAQPVILEQFSGPHQPVHVYVIWDDWQHLSSIERSEIIMDAYEAVHGQKKSLNVTVAMGLTSAEADRLGIHYQ